MSANKLLLDWAKKQDTWLQDGLRQLVQNGPLDDDCKQELLNMGLHSHGLLPKDAAQPRSPIVLTEKHLDTSLSEEKSFILTSLHTVEHVNALAPNQELTFGSEGLTVIYGENGSGKSGYSRILKNACSSRDTETILPNIFAGSTDEASAIFTVAPVDAHRDEHTVKWRPGTLSPQLQSLAFLDSGCARVILDDKNAPAYSTELIDTVTELGQLIGWLRDQVTARGQKVAERPAELENVATTESRVANELKLDNPKLTVLTALKTLSEEELAELSSAHLQLVALKTEEHEKIAKRHDARATAHANRLTQLKSLELALSASALKELTNALLAGEEATTVARELTDRSCKDAPLSGVGSSVWKNLFLSARAYSTEEAYRGKDFPNVEASARCPLCMQGLDADAKARLRLFDEMASGTTEKLVTEANAVVGTLRQRLDQLPARKEFDDWVNVLTDTNETLGIATRTWLTSAAAVRKNFNKIERAADGSTVHSQPPFAHREAIEACIKEEEKSAKDARDLHDPVVRQQKMRALELTIRELDARKELAARWAVVEPHLKSLTQADAHTKLAKSLKPASATTLGKKIVETVLTAPLRLSLDGELDQMGYSGRRPELKSRGQKSELKQELTFDSKKAKHVSDILSEGEQRILSLALFLAELKQATGTPGIIFDDPVCSLDHRWLEKIAERLAQEATKRQVIVFTHSIAFLMALERHNIEQSNCFTSHSLHALPECSGTVRPNKIWDAMKISDRLIDLGAQLKTCQALFAQDPSSTDYHQASDGFLSSLRSTWERFVEQELLGKVVQRFSSAVKTQSLCLVEVSDSTYRRVFQGMQETSALIRAHDHAASSAHAAPTPDKLDALLRQLTDLRQAEKNPQKERQQRRKALTMSSIV